MYQQVYIACEISPANQEHIKSIREYVSWHYPSFEPRNAPHVTLKFLWEADEAIIDDNLESIKSIIQDYSEEWKAFCSTTYSYLKFRYRPQFEKGYISLEPFLPTMSSTVKDIMERFIGRSATPHITLGTIAATSTDFITLNHKRELVEMVKRDKITVETNSIVVKWIVDGEEYKIIKSSPL